MLAYRLGPRLAARNGGLTVRLTEDARKCVVFFGVPSPPDGKTPYGGTGCLISVDEGGFPFGYVVTNRHVAKRLEGDFKIRVNLKSGGVDELLVERVRWSYHPDPTVDLAATYCAMSNNDFNHLYLPLERIVTDEEVWVGAHINIVGLFRLHYGEKRNIPIVHTGNIAALADERVRIRVRDRMSGETIDAACHLVEAQTLDGLSGSPIFVHDFVKLKTGPHSSAGAFGTVRLLGLYQGSWDGEPGAILEADKDYRSGKIRVPIGRGLAVPGGRIRELLMDDPQLKGERLATVDVLKNETAASMDVADSFQSERDENPNHREDFMRLVNEVSKAKKQDGQT
jgi:hypothetical protein